MYFFDGDVARPKLKTIHYPIFGGDLDDAEQTKRAYRALFAETRALVPEGPRRLEYRLGQGWEPLCTFLDKPVPQNVPFPHVNEGKYFYANMAYVGNCARMRIRPKFIRFFSRLAGVSLIALESWWFLPRDIFTRRW